MEDYYEYLDSNGVTTLYKLIKDDTVALIDSYSVTLNGITTNLDTHINDSDIHTPITDIENMVDTKISGLVNSAPETLDTLKELSDALGSDPNFATTLANQIGTKANKDNVYTKGETDTLLESKANSVHNHVVSDITDFPTIPTKLSQLENDMGFGTGGGSGDISISWTNITDKPNFSDIAISGSYNDLVDTPNIPTKTSDLTNDSGYITSVSWNDVTSKPVLSQVAISGSYSDLNDTPTIPTKTSQLINDSGFLTSSNGVITSVSWSDIKDKPNFSTVATSGSYTDLSNTPNIPTKLSQLENDTGFINALTDVVDTKSNQIINGTKTFTSGPWVTNNHNTTGFSIKNTALARNDVPSAYQHYTFRAYDKNNNILGEYCIEKTTLGDAVLNMGVRSEDSSGTQIAYGLQFRMTNNGSVVRFMPSANNKVHLGDVNAKWLKVHSDDVVHTSGNEDISGYKKFTADIVRKYTAVDITTTPTSDMYAHINFTDKNDKSVAYIQYAQRSNGVDYIGLRVRDKNSTTWGVQLNTNKEFVPLGHNTYSLGTSDRKWGNVYATTVNGNLKGTIDSTTTATTQATSDNSTKIATTAWVRTYVDSVAGSNTVGSSISAYYSNATTVTAKGTSPSSSGSFPSVYSDYINISPTVGTIYTGSQLFSSFTPTASGTQSGFVYQTTAIATATFSGAFSASAKYLCTTANAVRFRAYVSQGSSTAMGSPSVVDNSSAKSIFIRVQ